MCLHELPDDVPGLLHVLGPGLQGCTRHLVVVNVFSSFSRVLDVNVDVVTFTGCDKEHSKDETTEAKKKNEKAENSDKSNKTRSARAKSNAVSTKVKVSVVLY